jgi:GNAT superfamily N-acetyltransferase
LTEPSYELAAYEPAQREDYLRLLQDAWGDVALTPAEFDWWFDRNPAGSLMSVARMNGRVVGVAAHSLLRMVLDGEERLASFSVHATTAAEARGQGIFVALERKHEEEAAARDVAVVLAFASKPTAPLFLGPLGWTEIGRARIWARPFTRLAPRSAPVAQVERFRHGHDAARSWPNHVVRDPEYLNWRFVASPRDYVTLADGGDYVVLGHKEHRGVSIATVADLIADDPKTLLRACLRRVKPEARALFAIPSRKHRRAYLSLGFLPTSRTLHVLGKPLAGMLNPDPRAWRFTLGDTDFF